MQLSLTVPSPDGCLFPIESGRGRLQAHSFSALGRAEQSFLRHFFVEKMPSSLVVSFAVRLPWALVQALPAISFMA